MGVCGSKMKGEPGVPGEPQQTCTDVDSVKMPADPKKTCSENVDASKMPGQPEQAYSKYVDPKSISDALAEGHTVLIDAQWFIEAKIGAGHFRSQEQNPKHPEMLSRQEMEADYASYVISEMKPQEIYIPKLVTSDTKGRWSDGLFFDFSSKSSEAKYFIAVISYPWRTPEHPDPGHERMGFNLRQLSKILKIFDDKFKKQGLQIVVFIDYMSLYQNLPGAPRTEQQKDSFSRGLKAVNIWYTHPATCKWVLRFTSSGTNYDDRGWCTFERMVSAFQSSLIFDVSGIGHDGTKTHWVDYMTEFELTGGFDYSYKNDLARRNDDYEKSPGVGCWLSGGGAGSSTIQVDKTLIRCLNTDIALPPLTPEKFSEVIEEKTFTNGKTDKPFVIQKYAELFAESLASATELSFVNRGWTDQEAFVLAETLERCKKLQRLHLTSNKMGRTGILEIARCCPGLVHLGLIGNGGGRLGNDDLSSLLEHCKFLTCVEHQPGCNRLDTYEKDSVGRGRREGVLGELGLSA